MRSAEEYAELAETAWAWVLTQVRYDDLGPWLPEKAGETGPGEYRFGMHSGADGLAHVLAEIRLTRDLAPAEAALGDEIAAMLTDRIPVESDYDYFTGLTSHLGVLTALGATGAPGAPGALLAPGAPGAEQAVARLADLRGPDGWPTGDVGPPRARPEATCNDATLGTAAVLLGALWAMRHDVPGAAAVADDAAALLLAEGEERGTGVYWPFVPLRFLVGEDVQMPNWSHGQAGIAGTMAAAGTALERPDLVALAVRGAEHLVTMGDTSDGGLRLDHRIPGAHDVDTYTYTWCHGPAGTSLLFSALDRAGVPAVGDRTPYDWERACLHSLLVSGIPQRLHPGFWDNDGRCCGTAGVGDVVLSMWQRHGRDDELAFAVTLAEALVERAIDDGDHTYWRYLEHRNAEPLLPPRVGWMQGVAGIAAYLFRLARVLEQGRDASAVARMDTWWSLPDAG